MNAESSTVQGSVHFATKTNYLKIFCFVWSNLSQILKYFILDLSTSKGLLRLLFLLGISSPYIIRGIGSPTKGQTTQG